MALNRHQGRLLVVAVLLQLVTLIGAYNQPTSTSSLLDIVGISCPQHCSCNADIKTAQCSFKNFSEYSLKSLVPRQVVKLQIQGPPLFWDSDLRYSVKDVLRNGFEQDKELADRSLIETFSNITYLEFIYVPVSVIGSMDLQFMTKLEHLTIAHGLVHEIQPDAFKNLVHLEYLNLEGNRISELDSNVFSNLRSLVKFQLRSNNIKHVDAEMFNSLKSLKDLDLQNNALSSVETFLPNLTIYTLQKLNLGGNKIYHISSESVGTLKQLLSVDLSENRLMCTCINEELIQLVTIRPDLFNIDVTCYGPADLKDQSFKDVKTLNIKCDPPTIDYISENTTVQYQRDAILHCDVQSEMPYIVYWITPWGETYSSSVYMFNTNLEITPVKVFGGVNLMLASTVYVTNENALTIKKFRGIFAGQFTCVVESLIGVSNKTTSVDISNAISTVYFGSMILAAYITGSILILAIFIGILRLIVNKCCHNIKCCCCYCCVEEMSVVDVKKVENGHVETTYAISQTDSIEYMDDDFTMADTRGGQESPPYPPFNSPMLRMSPEKCRTPSQIEVEDEKAESSQSQHILEQLDEVRLRLYAGAGRKIEKVRSHVRSFTDTGTIRIRLINKKVSVFLVST